MADPVGPRARHVSRSLLGVALAATLLATGLDWAAAPRVLRRETYAEPALRGDLIDDRVVTGIDDYATRGPALPTRMFSLRWTGYRDVPPGRYDMGAVR